MSFPEEILKIRQKFAEAIDKGVVSTTQDYEAILIQIMNDAERNRQTATAQAENARRQAATFDGQAAAFSSIVSSVYAVLSGFIKTVEKNKLDEARVAAEQAEKAEALELEKAAEKKKSSKKASK